MPTKKPITYSKEIATKKFTGATMKAAYMSGMKWYATNILATNDCPNIQVSVTKVGTSSVELHIFVTLDEQVLRDRNCKICKEMHTAFYSNDNCNCNWCNVNAYQKRADEMLSNTASYYKEKLSKCL